MRATPLLSRIACVWLVFGLFPLTSWGQAKASAQSPAKSPPVIRVGIRDFRKLVGGSRVDALEETLPHLLRAGLFFQRSLDVSLLGKASPESAGTGQAKSGASQRLASADEEFDFIVEGNIVEVSEDRIRVDILLRDVQRRGIVFRDSVDLNGQQMVVTMGQLADRLAGYFRDNVLLTKTAGRLVAVVGPFDSMATDPSNFLTSLLPLKVSENPQKKDSGKNMVFAPIIPGSSTAAPSSWDIKLTGNITTNGSSIVISGTYQERSGLTLPLEHSGPAAEPLKAVDAFSRSVWEVLAGRVSPAGAFRKEPVLAGNSSPEALFARAQEYEKSGESDAALFLYEMALRKKSDYLDARLHVAAIYRNQEAYELAEAQYRQALAQSNQNAAVHYGLGLLFSKEGKYEQAVQELEQAASLAPGDRQMQFEVQMRLGDVSLLLKQPDPDGSIQHYLRAQAMDQTSPVPYLSLGKASRAKNDLDGAIAYLRKGLALWPADKALKNDLAAALNDLGKQREDAKDPKALEAYQETLALDPPDVHLKAAAYLAVGRAYRLAQKYKEAIAALTKAVELAPQFDPYWELALSYRLSGEYGLGIEACKKAVEADPQNTDGYTLLGALYESKFSESKTDRESFYQGVENLKLAIQKDAGNEAAHRILGVLYHEGGQDENAVSELQQAISINPTVWSYSILGESFSNLKKKDEAIAAFREGLKLDARYEEIYNDLEKAYSPEQFVQLLKDTLDRDPKFTFACIKLGLALRKQKKYEEAFGWLEKAIALEPNNEWANRVMGVLYSDIAERDKDDTGKSKAAYQRAIGYLDKAVQIDPTEWSHEELEKIYAALGDDQKAVENFEKAIQINPLDEDSYETAVGIYERLKRSDDFYRLLEAVVAKNPRFYWGRTELATRYYSLGRYDEAIEQTSKAIELEPDEPEPYQLLAEAQLSKKEYAKAYENARKALALDPKDQDSTFRNSVVTLANTLIAQKDYQGAVRDLEALLPQNRDSATLLAQLGNAHRLNKSFPQAEDYLKKAIALAPRFLYAYWVLGQTYTDAKQFPEALATARDALKINPEYSSALALLYNAEHELKKDQEAAQFLDQLLAGHPQSRSILESIGFVTHEFTREYDKSYDAYKKVYAQEPDNWSVVENFAEASLTVGQLDQVLELTKKVLSAPDASPQSKLSMMLFQIAAYLLKGEQGRAFAELGLFRDEYKRVPKDYERGWTYEGTKLYVSTRAGIKPAEKALLLQMIALLEAPLEKADTELQKFEDSFAKTFVDLKAAAVPN